MLSAHERRQLRIIEHGLETDEDFVRTLTGRPSRMKHGRRAMSILLAVLAAALAVLGIVATVFPVLFLAAVTAMTAACLQCTRRNRTRDNETG
jgi:hypothetical protein